MVIARAHSTRHARPNDAKTVRLAPRAVPRLGPIAFLQRHLGNRHVQRIAAVGAPTPGAPRIQRACACGGTCADCAGTCADCAGHEDAERVQTKLTVGPPGDRYEREADRVADQVVRMPESHVQRQTAAEEEVVQTKPLAARITPLVQREAEGGPAPPVLAALPMGGARPLSAATRAFIEPHFGVGFGGVRLHTGAAAERAAARLHARAFTVGRDVWLGRGEREGDRRLMAHELTHVVQQSGGGARSVQRLPFGIELPSGARSLDTAEEAIGRGVYGSSLNYGDIYISDALGGGGRPFTLYIPFVGTVLQLGPGPYGTPGSDPDLLIHEMAHSWQSQHHRNPGAYMVNSLESQAGAALAGGGASAYCYIPGKPFSEYGAEQIAEQAEDGVTAIQSHMSSMAAGSIDPDLNLDVARWEVRGAPGVRC